MGLLFVFGFFRLVGAFGLLTGIGDAHALIVFLDLEVHGLAHDGVAEQVGGGEVQRQEQGHCKGEIVQVQQEQQQR